MHQAFQQTLASTLRLPILRTLQVLLALTITIIYGIDLGHFTSTGQHAPASWIYAEVVAALSIFTSTLYGIGKLNHYLWKIVDFVLCVMWAAQAGDFGMMYLGGRQVGVEFEVDEERMKAGVGIGLVCMLLWLGSFVMGLRGCVRTRGSGGTKRVDRTMETAAMMERGVYRPPVGLERGETCMQESLPTYDDAMVGEKVDEKGKLKSKIVE